MLEYIKNFIQSPVKSGYFSAVALLVMMLAIIPTALSASDKVEKFDPKSGKPGIKPLVLWAQQGSGDFLSWTRDWKDNTLPNSLKLQWKHNFDNVGYVGWEIFKDGSRIKGPVSVGPIPDKVTSAFFSIPFQHEVGTDTGSYEVRIAAYTANPSPDGIGIKPFFLGRSDPPVAVRSITGGDTQISLPKLRVTFSRIHVVDDSDKTSPGDLGFGFWVSWSGGKSEVKTHTAHVSSGDDTNFNIDFVIDRASIPGTTAFLHVYGFDDDETEWAPLGPFILLLLEECGQIADPNAASSDCPGDTAEGSTPVDTYLLSGSQGQKKNFTIYANGPELRFEAYGHYRVTPK